MNPTSAAKPPKPNILPGKAGFMPPPPVNLPEALLHMMLQFQRKLIRPSNQLTRPSMSPVQFQALSILAFEGPRSMSELASSLLVSKQQITPIIDKLEQGGLVERTPDTTDRRVIRLSLSRQGLQFLEEKKKEFVEMAEAKLSGLPEADKDDLMAAMLKVSAILDRLP